MNERIPTRSKRQAMDWSLVLLSQEIESVVDRSTEEGWGLVVKAADHERALGILRQYQHENRRWPWRQEIRSEILFDWGSLAWVALLCVFYWLQSQHPHLETAGLMDRTAVSHGAWWRLFTAVFLHADLAHLASNAGIGFILLGLVMGRYGTGIGLLAAFLAGVGGNVATWLVYEKHQSLGASGMVMGCLGLLATQSVSLIRDHPRGWKYFLSALVGGVMLFVFLGLSPDTDVTAHLGGFVAGLLLGSILLLAPRSARSTAANLIAGAIFCALTILTWWMALKGS